MRLSRTLTVLATAACTTLVTASSTIRNPLRAIALAKNPSILTPNHRVTAVSTFDVALDVSGTRLRLSLEPNHDIFVDGAVVQYLGADGEISRQEPIDRLQHKVYKGTAWLKRGNRWDNVGWSRVSVRRDGPEPLFEGVFTVNDDHHHILLSSNYKKTRMALDPDVDLRDDEYMVVFRDSDMLADLEHTELRKRSGDLGCRSDSLSFNMDLDHPVYASMRPRSESFITSAFSSLLGKRQNGGDQTLGGNSAGVNLVSTIGNTAGCPTSRKVALVGVATDCTYTKDLGSDNATKSNVIQQMNAASSLFESTFNISLGLANLIVTPSTCPTTVQQATQWNQACSGSVNIEDRLNLFSSWRGQQNDNYSHWTLLSTCNTDSAVGLAWLGQACAAGAQGNSSGGQSVAGANVVVRTSTEWQVIAHETGHTFGAVHDCDSQTCQDANTVNSQQCCPLSANTCDAGAKFIMNPSTGQGIEKFSACSVGNICSALGRNSVKSNCLSNNKGVTLLSGQTCGNGIVEGDEECDCGGTKGCGSNACCDASTCKFKNNAVCDDSNEDCCTACQFASSNKVCRASASSCDPEEKCTGNTPYCPNDQTNPDGTDCGNGLQCASGQCTSRDQQCKTVMGSYTTGNDTYACDNSNCMLTCASPEFGANTCYSLQQNFLDGTPCVGGGSCQNGQCTGSSVAKEVKSWIDDHKTLVIGIASAIGGLLVLSILGCCWRSYKRRKMRKVYVSNAAVPRPPPPGYGYGQNRGGGSSSRSRSRRRGPTSPTGSGGPLMNQSVGPPPGPPPGWQGHNIPEPPPMYQRQSSMRYA
ncbi:ADAM 8 precursor [Lophiostoma macrostomum CBS 122681]|uniref:Disintegrin and metalloproteinase domain-containing protein B n=1 Tax=Lophiostoma macrostomum CBS 122681 TaxID=1314788 RepID=A0A6A6SW92_9PLEO|nr:ADAM 8 precursor [Lophiostoma macrostomum CBS 122681]